MIAKGTLSPVSGLIKKPRHFSNDSRHPCVTQTSRQSPRTIARPRPYFTLLRCKTATPHRCLGCLSVTKNVLSSDKRRSSSVRLRANHSQSVDICPYPEKHGMKWATTQLPGVLHSRLPMTNTFFSSKVSDQEFSTPLYIYTRVRELILAPKPGAITAKVALTTRFQSHVGINTSFPSCFSLEVVSGTKDTFAS